MKPEQYQLQAQHMTRELKRYGYDPESLTENDLCKLHISLSQHLISESVEILDCASWKLHKRGERVLDPVSHIAEECVDLYKFMMNILALHNVSQDYFDYMFMMKSRVVEERVKWEEIKTGQKPYLFIEKSVLESDALCRQVVFNSKVSPVVFTFDETFQNTPFYFAAIKRFTEECNAYAFGYLKEIPNTHANTLIIYGHNITGHHQLRKQLHLYKERLAKYAD
jgi:hypothetical protein